MSLDLTRQWGRIQPTLTIRLEACQLDSLPHSMAWDTLRSSSFLLWHLRGFLGLTLNLSGLLFLLSLPFCSELLCHTQRGGTRPLSTSTRGLWDLDYWCEVPQLLPALHRVCPEESQLSSALPLSRVLTTCASSGMYEGQSPSLCQAFTSIRLPSGLYQGLGCCPIQGMCHITEVLERGILWVYEISFPH